MLEQPSYYDHQPSLAPAPFVGRERELRALRDRFEQVLAGQGQIVSLAGEPGIGKTRLIEEFIASVTVRDAAVLWGRCDAWDATPAYWPWIQILRSYVGAIDDAALRSNVGAGAADIVHLLPEVAERLSLPAASPNIDPGQARFQLFDALSTLLANAARPKPLVLVLDDVHWADAPSLALLQFLARRLRDARILVLLTYRHGEVNRQHPLADTLTALARESVHQRILLRGLSSSDTAAFVERISGREPSDELTRAIHQQTDGNPFFLGEITRLAVSNGTLNRVKGSVERTLQIPESVHDVIGERLNRLSVDCNQILSIAAVIGREFSVPLLARVSARSAHEVLEGLDDAVDARIIEEQNTIGQYRFSHALIREVLYDELRVSKRVQLHQRIGEGLEHLYAANLEAHSAELSRHFSIAAPLDCAGKAVAYALKAAETAMAQHAWETAIDYYQLALQTFDLLGAPNPVERCEMLLALGEAQNRAGKGRERTVVSGVAPEAVETFRQAVHLARVLGSPEQFARAVLGLTGPNLAAPYARQKGIALMEESLDALSADDSPLRAQLLARVAVDAARLWAVGEYHLADISRDEVKRQSDEAMAIARRTRDARTLAYVLAARYLAFEGPDGHEDWLADADEILRLAEVSSDPELAVSGFSQRYTVLVEAGRMAMASRTLDDLERLCRRLQTPLLEWLATTRRSGEALRRGRFGDAETLIARAQLIWPQTAASAFQLTTLRREQSRMHEVEDLIRIRHDHLPNSSLWRVLRIVLQFETGQDGAARAGFEEVASKGFQDIPRGLLWFRTMEWLAEIVAQLRDPERARQLYDLLLPYAGRNTFVGNSDHTGGSVSYYLGLLATTMSRWEVAERHFRKALSQNEQWGIRPYVAYTHYAWADMLLRRRIPTDRSTALEMIDQALSIAEGIGMIRLAKRAHMLRKQIVDALATDEEGAAGKQQYGLSLRELDVLRLIVAGETDREIAGMLFISRRTVGSHVSHILAKLGVATRTEAATIAVREGLV